jgi:Predicted permeases
MNSLVLTLLKLCPFIFLAGFIDAIAGGGGLISLPAYLFSGVPMHNALATNKLSSTLSTVVSTYRYIINKKFFIPVAIPSAAAAVLGSVFGAKATLAVDEKYLRYFLLAVLPLIAVFMLTNKKFGEENTYTRHSTVKLVALAALSGLVIGFYDGFFGPGTGTFLMLIYAKVLGFNLVNASGNAKVTNLSSNVGSLIQFIVSGKVIFALGLIASVFGILGSWLGSGYAIKRGPKAIKPILVVVLVILFSKVLIDIL